VAELVRFDPEALARLLDAVPGLLPGAERDADGWKVPESALRVILGAPSGPLPVLATVAEVAECLRFSKKTVYAWLKLRRPDKSAVLPSRWIMGELRIEARHVLALPERSPAPPPFFCAERRAKR
jgi:hypothetical protein